MMHKSNEWDFEVLHHPLIPCDECPNGMPGAVRVFNQCYLVTPLCDSAGCPTLVRFDGMHLDTRTGDWSAKFYTVNCQTLECTCPGSQFRRSKICRHAKAVQELGLTMDNGEETSPVNEDRSQIPF